MGYWQSVMPVDNSLGDRDSRAERSCAALSLALMAKWDALNCAPIRRVCSPDFAALNPGYEAARVVGERSEGAPNQKSEVRGSL
jgi:hypothetical protein